MGDLDVEGACSLALCGLVRRDRNERAGGSTFALQRPSITELPAQFLISWENNRGSESSWKPPVRSLQPMQSRKMQSVQSCAR